MNKIKINYWIDAGLLLSVLITAFTALVIFFFLPSGVRQSGYQEFWGVTKRVWGDWHKWSGMIFMTLALIHYILHLNWITAMTKNIFSKKSPEIK